MHTLIDFQHVVKLMVFLSNSNVKPPFSPVRVYQRWILEIVKIVSEIYCTSIHPHFWYSDEIDGLWHYSLNPTVWLFVFWYRMGTNLTGYDIWYYAHYVITCMTVSFIVCRQIVYPVLLIFKILLWKFYYLSQVSHSFVDFWESHWTVCLLDIAIWLYSGIIFSLLTF